MVLLFCRSKFSIFIRLSQMISMSCMAYGHHQMTGPLGVFARSHCASGYGVLSNCDDPISCSHAFCYKIHSGKYGRWTPAEKAAFLTGLRRFGRGKWKEIAKLIPSRSTGECGTLFHHFVGICSPLHSNILILSSLFQSI